MTSSNDNDAGRERTGHEPPGSHRPTRAEIDLDALAHNFRAVRRRVAEGVRVMAVVKADAYGHGAFECARRLASEGADWFGVATPGEAAELRRAGISQPVLCFQGFWDGRADFCLRESIVPVVYRIDMAEALDRAARNAGVVADVHVKLDTGMGRLGMRFDEAAEFADALRSFEHLRVDGLMTHFAAADEPRRDCFTDEQLKRFRDGVAAFRERGFRPTYVHMANSAATFAHAQTHGDMVRPGGVLYGLWRDILPATVGSPDLRPVMKLTSSIILIKRIKRGESVGYGCTYEAARDMTVATLPIGYHDGYPRAMSNRGRAIVRGAYASVVGRVSMDMTLLDVTDVPGASTGDAVTLLGVEGEHRIDAEDIARTVNTLSYEITCGMSSRVPRRYATSEE